MISPRKLLITAKTGKASNLYAYDVRTAVIAKLARIPIPAGTTLFPDGFTTARGRIAWWTARGPDDERTADIWTVPATGGTPRRIASTPLPAAASVTGLAITEDGFAWSAGETGVFTVGSGGGRPRHLEGTRGQHILSWPWVGSPGRYDGVSALFRSVMNVETGERRGRPKNDVVTCGVSLCVTRVGRSVAGRVEDRDGRIRHEMSLEGVAPEPLAQDRFITARLPDRAVVHDVRSGVSAEVRPIDTRVRHLATAGGNIALFTRDRVFVIVDLTAVAG